jgi:hypothetical protein
LHTLPRCIAQQISDLVQLLHRNRRALSSSQLQLFSGFASNVLSILGRAILNFRSEFFEIFKVLLKDLTTFKDFCSTSLGMEVTISLTQQYQTINPSCTLNHLSRQLKIPCDFDVELGKPRKTFYTCLRFYNPTLYWIIRN